MNHLFPSNRRMRRLNRSLWDQGFDSLFADDADFSVDIKDQEDEYLLIADLPGLDKENIELNYENSVLSIGAHQEQETEEKHEEGNYIRRERSSRSYNRQFLIENVVEEEIEATFENGVLTVHLPKREKEETDRKRIDIK